MPLTAKQHSDAAQAIFGAADREGRQLTPGERKTVASHLLRAEEAKDISAELRRISGGGELVRPSDPYAITASNAGPGDIFVASEGYKRIQENRGSTWSTGAVEVQTKATLLEGDLSSPGAGAALAQPDVRPGIQPLLSQPPTLADVIPSTPVTTNRVRTIVETTATSAAASVAEGGEKPESTFVFDEVDEPIIKVATVIPVSDELLSDAPAIQGYLNQRLTLFIRQEEEDQLLNATGSGSDLDGLLNRVPVGNQDVVSTATSPTAVDHVHSAITKVRESFLDADTVVLNPEDWAVIRLLKDQNENYIGGSPFSNGQPQPNELLFGRRVLVTTAISAGTGLIGAFATGATLFRRGGVTVEATNAHDDYFVRNLVLIRAESRLGLGVARPQAFATAALNAS